MRPLKRYTIFFSFFFILLLCTGPLTALDPGKAITQYRLNIWNMRTGLPGNTVFTLTQTGDGYLWIGTQDGLVRFDGIRFQLYDKNKVPQLRNNVIRALFADRSDNLWIGTSPGGLTRLKDGRFYGYPLTECRGLEGICAINEDRRGNLWFGSLTRGLTCLSNGTFTTYTTKEGLPHNQVRFISKDAGGDLWVTTAVGIVKVIEPGIFEGCAGKEALPYLKTSAVYNKNTGNLWIGTGANGLFRLKNGKVTHYGTEAGLPHQTVTCMFVDSIGNPWIGTDGGGLARMSSGTFQTLPLENPRTCGYINSIFEDREGSLWVGTLDGGVYQLGDSKFTTFTSREGIRHGYINCIYKNQEDHLWIAAKNEVYRLDGKKAFPVMGIGEEKINNNILSIIEDPDGYIWIGTWNGLYRYKNGIATPYKTEQGLSDNRVRCMTVDKKGNVWIGTHKGLNRFNKNDGTFSVFTTRRGLLSNQVEHVFEDRKETVWICTASGINLFKDGKITRIPPYEGIDNSPDNSIDNIIIRSAFEDKEGTLWLGSTDGLFRLENRKITHYDTGCGLMDNHIYSILDDETGYLWLGGRNGVSRIPKKELTDLANRIITRLHPASYNEHDGMKSRWCTGPGCKTSDGRLWFPTSVGVTMIDPSHIKKNGHSPSLIIEKLIVDGETVDLQPYLHKKRRLDRLDGNRNLDKIQDPPGKSERLELMPGKIRLDFHYTAPSFIKPEKIRFKIMLQGYDDDWVDMGARRHTTYTGLPSGEYTFKATACNADGTWNLETTSLTFYLRSYFFQTTWFFILAVLLVLAAALFLPLFRIKQLKARGKKLNRLVELRTRDLNERTIDAENAHQELLQSQKIIESKNIQLEAHSKKLQDIDELKSRFFANISHEFRTPLTLIAGPLEQIIGETSNDSLKSKMSLMLRNTRRLLTLVNQLLELAKFDSGIMKLKASRQDIVSLVQSIAMCFESLARQNEIELICQREEENIPLYFDAEKLEKIITNLLSNAFNYTPKGGKITVTIKKESGNERFPEGCVKISVRDTGAGIPPDQLPHIFDRFYRGKNVHGYHRKGTGIGLALTKELIELHKGEIRVNSCCRPEGNRGTEFSICLPPGKKHLKPHEIDESPAIDLPLLAMELLETSHDSTTAPEDIRQAGETSEPELTEENPQENIDSASGLKPVILLVEDNTDVRNYIREPLKNIYRVETAPDGRKGLEKAREIVPDLIISDVMMPEMDGYQLCRELKNDIGTSHIPIILLTAKASEESMIEGLETGADDYITKPFSVAILLVRIRNLIDLRRQLQQNVNREMTLQPSKISVSKIDREFLEDLQAVIRENMGDSNFSVDLLSKKLYMSNSTLYRKIQALTGETPTEFIRSYRLKKGAELLRNNYGTVLEVALEVGFSSANYFTKCFKKKFNLLPTEYRSAETIPGKTVK